MKLTVARIEELWRGWLTGEPGGYADGELVALLRSAKALAGLEEWLWHGDAHDRACEFMREYGGSLDALLSYRGKKQGCGFGPDLATAILDALDKAQKEGA